MKVTVDRQEFVNAASFVARMSPSRPTQPILTGVLIETGDGGVTFTVFDYERAAQTSAMAEISTPGIALVSAKLLASIASKLPKKPVQLTLEETSLRIQCGAMKAALPVMPAEEYPKPRFDGTTLASVPGAIFADALSRVLPAVAQDDPVAAIAGVRLRVGEQVEFASTDRYRASMMVIDAKVGAPGELVVPGPVLKEAARAFEASTEVWFVRDTDDNRDGLTITDGESSMFTLLISAQFPAVERLFEQSFVSTTTLDSDVLADAVQRAGLVIDGPAAIEFQFADGAARVSGAGDGASAVSEDIPVHHDGEPVTIAARPAFVIDGVNACQAETVRIQFTTARDGKRGPFLFTGPNAGFRYLLMPNLLKK